MLESLSFAVMFCTCEFLSTHKTRSCSPMQNPAALAQQRWFSVWRTGLGSPAFPIPIPSTSVSSCPPHCPQHPQTDDRERWWWDDLPGQPRQWVLGAVGGQEPPSSPTPSAEAISSHSPPACRDRDSRWRVAARAGERGSCPCTGTQSDLVKGGRAGRGGLSMDTACPLFTAFNNKAVAIATGLINASHLHN